MRSTEPATMASPLHALGLLTDDDLATVEKNLNIAHRAAAFAASAAVLRRNSILDATVAVMKAEDIEKAIVKSAGTVQPDAAADIAAQVEIAADTLADEIVRKNKSRYPAGITAAFDEMTQDAVEPLRELSGVTSPAEAIEYGVADSWKKLAAIKSRWDALDELVVALRLAGLIPAARNGDHGWHWAWREGPVDSYALQRARDTDPTGVTAFALNLPRGRFVAASADEAAHVLAAHEADKGAA